MVSISEKALEEATNKAAHRIAWLKEKRIVAQCLSAFNGKYVTKKLIPELEEAFPEYERIYLHNEQRYKSIAITVTFCKPSHRYEDYITLDIASTDGRRVDGEKLKEIAKDAAREADALEKSLANLQENAAQWNNMMKYVTRLANDLSPLFSTVTDFGKPDFYRFTY